MTREELRDYVEEQRSLGVIPYHVYSTLIDGIDTLEQEPKTENKGEWIPVSERLPKNNDDVLVYDNSDIFVAWYSGIEANWCSADNRFDEYTPIIAWQPLPAPYKKGGE